MEWPVVGSECHRCSMLRYRAENAERAQWFFFQSAVAGWLVAVLAIVLLVLDRAS